MFVSMVLILLMSSSTIGVVHIDRFTMQSNPAICDVAINYTHDARRNSIVDVNFTTFITVTSERIYVKARVPENENDWEFKREFLSTVVETEKIYRGMHSNPLLKIFCSDIFKSMEFDMKFPFPPVRGHASQKTIFSRHSIQQGFYRIRNLSFDYPFFVSKMRGVLELRFVGKTVGSNATKFFAHLVFYFRFWRS